jgi:hypothetical protein
MGNNDAREQLEVCKREYTKLEAEHIELQRKHFFLLERMYDLLRTQFNEEMTQKILEEYE